MLTCRACQHAARSEIAPRPQVDVDDMKILEDQVLEFATEIQAPHLRWDGAHPADICTATSALQH
jgi:hypothetical protein